jgi:hypothetical protein
MNLHRLGTVAAFALAPAVCQLAPPNEAGVTGLYSAASGEPAGPPAGSIADHFGFAVKDLPVWLARWKASRIEIEQTGNPIQGYVHGPDGIRVEFFRDPSIDTPVKMDHIHFWPLDTSEIRACYASAFGGRPGQRPCFHAGLDRLRFLSAGKFSFSKQQTKLVRTAGRSLDDIDLEVKNLDCLSRR